MMFYDNRSKDLTIDGFKVFCSLNVGFTTFLWVQHGFPNGDSHAFHIPCLVNLLGLILPNSLGIMISNRIGTPSP